jgi:hypothetical protein
MKMAVAKTVKAETPAAEAQTAPAVGCTDIIAELKAEAAKTTQTIFELRQQLAEKTAEVERLTVELAKSDNEVTALREANSRQELKYVELEKELVESLKEARIVKKELVAGKDYLELVAVPDEGVAPPPDLTFGGVKCQKGEDGAGFAHFKVPVKHAYELLAATSGMKFVLVEPKEKIVITRRIGLMAKDVEILPHVLDTHGSGKPYWKPLKVVESKG